MTEQRKPIDHGATARAAVAVLSRTRHQQEIAASDLIGDADPNYVIDFLCILVLHAFRQGGFDVDDWLAKCGIAFAEVGQ